MRLRVRFANNENEYKLVTGSVIKENFNETLDDAVIHLTNIYEEERLHINPYDYCHIYDLDSNHEWFFIVDNYVESYVNLNENIYDYQIQLMSPTKWLEKIQLPNRTILHSLKSGQSTIREQIAHFCELYIPKVKITNDGETWEYDYLIDFRDIYDPTKAIYNKFNVKCPDLSFNSPTLRQALMNLMNIVGCTPKIRGRKLDFLDFRQEPSEFIIPEGKKFDFKESLSSDSYVNTLTVMGESILGENNLIKNEILGFRDKDNAIIKHTENLKITTQYPIAKIENLTLCGNAKGIISGFNAYWNGTRVGTVYTKMVSSTKMCFYVYDTSAIDPSEMFLPIVKNITIKLYNATLTMQGAGVYSLQEIGTQMGSTISYTQAQVGNEPGLAPATELTVNSGFDYAVITFTGEDNEVYSYVMINNIIYTDYDMRLRLTTDLTSPLVRQLIYVYFVYRKDITPIVLESGARRMLSTRTDNVPEITNDISDLATSYYTTVSYQYGGTTIEGWSQSYSFLLWYGQQYTEIFISKLWEEIVKKWATGDVPLTEYLKAFGITQGGDKYELWSEPTIENDTRYSEYSQLFFDITYQPFNSVNLKYSKNENIPVELTQLDNQETSIPALLPFSVREQEKIERLGNSVLQIHQSQVVDLSEMNLINSKYGDYTIFSGEVQIYEGFVEINYVAAKNYVLKNYFTSIETKYRAYEYVDFNSTTLRKENTKVYILLSNYLIDGDDKIQFYNKEIANGDETRLTYINKAFLNLEDVQDAQMPFNYALKNPQEIVVGNNLHFYKNDLSVLFFDKNIALVYKDFDSVSAGIKITDASARIGEDAGELLEGYLQQWIMRNEINYNDYNSTFYTNLSLYNKIGDINYIYPNESAIDTAVENSFNMPEFYINTSELIVDGVNTMLLGETNQESITQITGKLYYKSQDEVLSDTLQFEYYTDNENLEIAPEIHKLSFLNTNEKELYVVYNTTQELNGQLQESTSFIPAGSVITRGLLKDLWSITWASVGITSIEIRILDHEESGVYYGYSLLRIKRAFGNKLYVSLNDTKTSDIYSFNQNGLLELNYTTDKTTTARNCVVKIS